MALPLFLGMAGRGNLSQGELKPELRLKLYQEAIGHYEKAKALLEEGRTEDALHEIQKATRVVSAFPEAYALAQLVYSQTERPEKASEQLALFRQYGGEAASLYRLRDQMTKEVEVRRQFAPPPDFKGFPALLFCGVISGLLVAGLFWERGWADRKSKGPAENHSLILEPFHEDEESEPVSWRFKALVLLLPAPLILALLVGLGLRRYSDLIPILLFGWILIDLGIYLIFLADLSGLGGSRSQRPGGPGGF